MLKHADPNVARVRKRFESDFLPKYGGLWRAMKDASSKTSNETSTKRTAVREMRRVVDFVEAIKKNSTVSISIYDHDEGCECGCEPPILEDENDRAPQNTSDSVLIDLVGSDNSDDSDYDDEKDDRKKLPRSPKSRKQNQSITISLLSDSEDESFENMRSRPIHVPDRSNEKDEALSIDDDSSFELEFDDDDNIIDDLVEGTQKISLQDDKENSKPLVSKRERNPLSKPAFKKQRQSLTKELFIEFNRKAFGNQLDSVEVVWSAKLRTTAGQTRLKKLSKDMRPGVPVQRLATIELSTKVLTDQQRLESTLLHEMVHAAAWIIDGVSKPPHGSCFWKYARNAMKKIPGITITTTHTYEIDYKYGWACTSKNCSFVVKRQSRSVDVNRHCCGRCKSRLVEISIGTSRRTSKNRTASEYNLFVKEQSKTTREKLMESQRAKGKRNPKVSQAEVMKECARLWREKKKNNAATSSL